MELQKSISGCRNKIIHCSLFTDNRGIALVMVLILSAISLAIMAGLVYMVVTGTQISGIGKRYETALEAGMGGKEVTYQLIGQRGDPAIDNCVLAPTFLSTCLTPKLNQATTNWAGCDSSLTITTSTETSYDMTCVLGTYTAYSKIVNTVPGNSGADLGLTNKGVVTSNAGEVTVMSIPYIYSIEIDAENTANPLERAKLSILYEY